MGLIEEEIENSRMKVLALTLFKLGLILFSIAHLGSCFWWLIGRLYDGSYPDIEGYSKSWMRANVPPYVTKKTDMWFWSMHFSMATMTTVGDGDIYPTNTAEVVFTMFLLWISLIVFSGCMGVLMSQLTAVYDEYQMRRARFVQLTKYMHWRGVPRQLRKAIRGYLSFVWHADEDTTETEEALMRQLSPALKQDLCVHIFGRVFFAAPFLGWMRDNPAAMKKLAVRAYGAFQEPGDSLFEVGEVNTTIYTLVAGWVATSSDGDFGENERQSVLDMDESPSSPNTIFSRVSTIHVKNGLKEVNLENSMNINATRSGLHDKETGELLNRTSINVVSRRRREDEELPALTKEQMSDAARRNTLFAGVLERARNEAMKEEEAMKS